MPDEAPTATLDDPPVERSLLRDRTFRLIFGAAAVSTVGTHISFVAVPLVAVTSLNAGPGEVGLLGVLSTVAFLLIGLPAGAWLDRVRRRGVMIATDLIRFALLASVPVAWWLDVLTIEQLYVVVFVNGICTVFFDVGSQSYLPVIVPKSRLVEANSKLSSWDAGASVAGPSAAGFLVQLITAPAALAVDAVSYLWSALCLAMVRKPEPEPARKAEKRLLSEIMEGLRFVGQHPMLRPIAISGSITNFSIKIAIVMIPVMLKSELGLSAGVIGLFFTCGGLGIFFGAMTARRLSAWLGLGPTTWILGLVVVPFALLVPMVDRGVWLWVAMGCWLVLTYRIGVNNVILVSFRQRATPDDMLGRMNATMRFLMTGVLAIGAGVAGLIGEFINVRATLWVAAIGMAVVWIPLFFSPLRTMRELESA